MLARTLPWYWVPKPNCVDALTENSLLPSVSLTARFPVQVHPDVFVLIRLATFPFPEVVPKVFPRNSGPIIPDMRNADVGE
jgi:hypothetical protein